MFGGERVGERFLTWGRGIGGKDKKEKENMSTAKEEESRKGYLVTCKIVVVFVPNRGTVDELEKDAVPS